MALDGFIAAQHIDLGRDNPIYIRDQPIIKGDSGALTWRVRVTRDGKPEDLTGTTVTLYCARPGEGSGTVFDKGSVLDGGIAQAVIPQDAANIPGIVGCLMRISRNGRVIGLARMAVPAVDETGNDIIDSGRRIPGIDDVLAAVDRCNAAAGAAEASASKIDGMTVSVSTLAAGHAATVTITDNGVRKNIHFGIPRGNTGGTINGLPAMTDSEIDAAIEAGGGTA